MTSLRLAWALFHCPSPVFSSQKEFSRKDSCFPASPHQLTILLTPVSEPPPPLPQAGGVYTSSKLTSHSPLSFLCYEDTAFQVSTIYSLWSVSLGLSCLTLQFHSGKSNNVIEKDILFM